MRSVRTLSLNLRQSAILSMGGAAEGVVARFSDMGISFGNDGTMKIDDSDVLEEILLQRPEELTAFFSSESSPLAQMKSQLEAFSQDDGVIDALEDGVDAKLARLSKNIAKEEKHLIEYEEEQRRIFNELDAMLEAGQAQFDQVMASLNSLAY
jgi:flagellar capping protein FliD